MAAGLLLIFSSGALAAPPSVGAPVISEVGYFSGKLSAEVTPEDQGGGFVFLNAGFEYTAEPSDPLSWQPVGTGEFLFIPEEQVTIPVTVHASLTGLTPGTEYAVRTYGEISGSPEGRFYSAPTTFTTTASTPPEAEALRVNPSTTEAEFRATLNSGGLSTSYHVEFGPTSGYGSSTATKLLGAGRTEEVTVTALGLVPQREYHYRLIASNADGTYTGPDRTFLTAPLPGAETCANQQLRILQSARHLPECRAYEQVSPADKNGFAVQINLSPFSVAPDGTVGYYGTGSFEDATASLVGTGYTGQREEGGWTTRQASAPFRNFASLEFTNVVRFSRDGTHAITYSSRALAPGAIAGNYNVYLIDVRSGQLELMFSYPEKPVSPYPEGRQIAGTPNFDHVLIQEEHALTPDAIDNGYMKLYEFTEGQLSLVSYVPSESGGEEPTPGDVEVRWEQMDHAISDDGSRLFFSVRTTPFSQNGSAGAFMRENGHTVPLSVSQRAGDGSEVLPGVVRDASSDGSVVVFNSREPLTEESVAPVSAEGEALYRYDVVTETLVDLTATEPPSPPEAGFGQYAGVSDSGADIYFEADAQGGEGGNLYHWAKGSKRRFAEHMSAQISGFEAYPRFSLSPNGKFLAFLTYGQPTGFDNLSDGKCVSPDYKLPMPCQEAYLYDASANQLSCASCPVAGKPQGHAKWGVGQTSNSAMSSVSNDGRVYFASPDRLLPSDSNGYYDVYEFFKGSRALISTGGGVGDSFFAGVTPDATDVYFVTEGQLVSQDRDLVKDLYDARRGGGLAGQNEPPAAAACVDEACQPLPSAPPPVSQVGSLAAAGAQTKSCRAAARKHRKGKRNAHSARPGSRRTAAEPRANRSKKHTKRKSKKHAKRCRGGKS